MSVEWFHAAERGTVGRGTMSIRRKLQERPVLVILVGVMTCRVVLGMLFSLMLLLQANGEGHMLILLDLPALAIFGLSQFALGWPKGLVDAFDPAYLVCSLIGWLVVGVCAGGMYARLRRSAPDLP